MDRLPVETLHQIFVLACCDGGFTGRSLSLVCRVFQDVARPVRYHSVSLVGRKQVQCFLQCYKDDRAVHERQGSRCTPKIRHLFLRPNATGPNGIDDALHVSTAREVLCEVLRLAGPTLVTLLYTGDVRWEDLLTDCRCEFPNLKELTFSRRDKAEVYLRNRRLPYEQLPNHFPALRRLHAVYAGSHYPVEEVLGGWAKVAPNVSHVRLSGMGSADMPTRWVIKMSWPRERRPYPSVRSIVIQPRPPPARTRCGYARGQCDAMLQVLRRLPKRVPKDISYCLLEADVWGATFWEDWIDSVNGGTGV